MRTYKFLLLSILLSICGGCSNDKEENPQTTCAITLQETSYIHGCSFEADLNRNGCLIEIGSSGTRIRSDYVSQTKMTYYFDYDFFDQQYHKTIAILSVEVSVNENIHSFINCDATVRLKDNDFQEEFNAKVNGDFQNNNVRAAWLKEFGPFSGEILVTWTEGDDNNSFHIKKILDYWMVLSPDGYDYHPE